MAGKANPDPKIAPRPLMNVVGAVALAAAVFLGGLTMTAGWIALFFVGGDEPDPKAAPTEPVRVRAPAERGRANAAVEAVVAKALDVSGDDVRIVRGHTSARKVIEISDLSDSEVGRRLSRPGA